VTAPRAVGVRLTYDAVPAAVRDWVQAELGSPVVATAEQVGGMSPGCATRLTCADGSRAFVKAVGAELNPDTPQLFRREAAVLSHLGEHPLWARLLASYDDGAWVALLIEDVEGRHPDFDDPAELDAVLHAVDRLSEVLQERHLPASVPLVELSQRFRLWSDTLSALPEAPSEAPVPAWVHARAPHWAAQLRDLAGQPASHVAHWDIRVDNLLRRPGGELVFLDWGMAARGPAWADPLLARLERVEDPWFDASLPLSPALSEAGDDVVTAFLAGFGTHLAVRSVVAVDVNLPTLNDFRVRESRRILEAVARRTASTPRRSDLGARQPWR
jgi:hypothetical protein